MVASGELKAPIVIGRDHLDAGSVASPNRETEAMADGSDAVSDWPLLNALLNTASGATWVSIHHGGGVGMGYSQHAGVVIVCDGSRRRGEAHRAGAVERSGVGCDAARRRWLCASDRGCENEGIEVADARRLSCARLRTTRINHQASLLAQRRVLRTVIPAPSRIRSTPVCFALAAASVQLFLPQATVRKRYQSRLRTTGSDPSSSPSSSLLPLFGSLSPPVVVAM